MPIVLIGVLLFSCKSINPAGSPGPSTPPPSATAGVNVPLKVPKETLSKLLNSQIPTVLLQEKGLDMGSGVTGDLQMRRNGTIIWTALDSQRIQLTVPINVVGEVGLKPKGLGNLFQSKLPLNENFSPVFVIDPVINPDWSIGSQSFELVDLGGNLAVEVLGIQVDFSGLLSKEIRKWGNEHLTGGKKIASLKTIVDLAWAQVGKPFAVEWLGGNTAFSIQPQQINLNEYFDTDQNYNLWLGMDGKVNSHPANAAPSRAFPLTGLSQNDNPANKVEMIIPLTVSYDKLDELLKQNLDGKAFRVDRKTTMIPSNIKIDGKTLNGTLFVVGKPTYDAGSQSLKFDDINFKMESGSFGAQAGVGLKKRKIIRKIESRAIFPIEDVLTESLGSMTDRLGLSTPIMDLSVADLTIEPSGFYPMAKDLVIHMKASGKVDVVWK